MIDDTYPTFSCMYESYQEISKVRTLVLELKRSVRCWGCHFVLVSKFNKHLDAKGVIEPQKQINTKRGNEDTSLEI